MHHQFTFIGVILHIAEFGEALAPLDGDIDKFSI
jgi:hypothetical protein